MGMIRSLSAFAICACAAEAAAQDELELTCAGENWSLELSDKDVSFSFLGDTKMEVMLDTPAEGREWPRAMTLIGDRDSGVLILDQRMCGEAPYSAEVLTQRGTTPVLLVGCCQVAE